MALRIAVWPFLDSLWGGSDSCGGKNSMTVNDVLNMQLFAGYGKNDFSMVRGSFDYKKTLDFKRPLKKCGCEKTADGGYSLGFEDALSGYVHKIEVREQDGFIKADYAGKFPEDINRLFIILPSDENEHFYGCGETYSKFNLKGERVRIWTAEHQNIARTSKKFEKIKNGGKYDELLPFDGYESYYAQPTFTSGYKYFLHVFTDDYCEFDFTQKDRITLCLQEEPHFITAAAESFPELSRKLSEILERPRPLPEWIYDGAVIASQQGCESVDAKLEKAKEEDISISGVWCQDWCGCRRTSFGYQVMWNWRQSEELYPGLGKKIKQWNAQGVHFLGYINTFMAIEKDIYKEASKKGYCVKNKNGEDYLVTITTFPAAMIDFTNPAAYEWYKNIIKENMIGAGLSGWMADFGEYLPTDCVLYSGQDPEKLHNRWPAIWAKMNREAISECKKEDECFFFTRAGHSESVKYSDMMWSGDHHVDWSTDDGIGSVITGTLSLAMSGFCITHSDTGGYTTNEYLVRSKELLMRWMDMNVFSPLFRFHEGNQPQRNAQVFDDDELIAHLKRCTDWHIALKPYLKELEKEACEKGIPFMRPLFYHYDEPRAYDETTQYLLGRDLLVAPVLKEGASGRSVYLPEDKWVHLFTKKEYTGGIYEMEAAVGQIPVFCRKNGNFKPDGRF